MATGVPSRDKAKGGGTNHIPASRADIRNEWSCTTITPACLHGVDRGNISLLHRVGNGREFTDIVCEYVGGGKPNNSEEAGN